MILIIVNTELPDNLSVGDDLYLYNTQITQLPDNLSVGGSLYLNGTKFKVLYNDIKRDYKLRVIPKGSTFWFCAGCRKFESAKEAIDHWGSTDYPSPDRGRKYVKAIEDFINKGK